jgi:hypothetical protein
MNNTYTEFNGSLWVDSGPKAYLESTVYIRQYDNPHNTMEGIFTLYTTRSADLSSEIFIYQARGSDLGSRIRVRKQKEIDLHSYATIKYRNNSELGGRIEAIAGSFVNAFIEVSPNNVMYGQYEVMEAPRITKTLIPVKDAFTRSNIDYQTVNWGTEKRMLVGRDASKPDIEEFTSFLEYDVTGGLGTDKLIEKAVLRLYYQNADINGTPLEFTTNDKYWNELGVTYLNQPKPQSVITNTYNNNPSERYIEVDVTDIVKRWYDGTVTNFGLNIKSLTDTPVTFYTKENGIKQPTLYVTYIDVSRSYTASQYPLDATVFIVGRGFGDLRAKLTVHSDVGIEDFVGTLYVHRIGVPMPDDLDSTMAVSRPEMHSSLMVYRFEHSEVYSTITVYQNKTKDVQLRIGSTVPELHSRINVDPLAHLHSFITTKAFVDKDPNGNKDATLMINTPELQASVEVPHHAWLNGTMYIKNGYNEDFVATIAVPTYVGDKSPVGRDDGDIEVRIWKNKPELASTMFVYSIGDSDLVGTIRVYERTELNSTIAHNRPELFSTIQTKLKHEIDATINVKGSSWLDSTVMIKQINEIEAFFVVKAIDEKEATVGVSRPEIHGFIFRRYAEDNDLDTKAIIRAKDVADLHCRFGARGKSNGAYYFII